MAQPEVSDAAVADRSGFGPADVLTFVPGTLGHASWQSALDDLLIHCAGETLNATPALWSEDKTCWYQDVLGEPRGSTLVIGWVDPLDDEASVVPVFPEEGIRSASSALPESAILGIWAVSAAAAADSPRSFRGHGSEQQNVEWPQEPSAKAKGKPRTFDLVRLCSRVDMLEQAAHDSCPVCLDQVATGQFARTLPCFHILHERCAARYFRTKDVRPVCPMCRCHLGVCN